MVMIEISWTRRHAKEVKVKQVSDTSRERGWREELKWQSAFNLRLQTVTVVLLGPGCQQILLRNIYMALETKCFPLFAPATCLLSGHFCAFANIA